MIHRETCHQFSSLVANQQSMTDILLDVFPEEEKTARKTRVFLTNRATRTQSTSVFPFPQLFSDLITRRPHI